VRPHAEAGGRVRLDADLRRLAVTEVAHRSLPDVHGLVHLVRRAERRARADAVLAAGESIALDAGSLDGRPLRFALRARRAE
jgi:hypothetical protein